ncbi:group IIF secretory phospholipase A2-like isoform 1-T1 [Liasis olivaceus]
MAKQSRDSNLRRKPGLPEMRLSHVAVVLGASALAFAAGSLLNFKLMIQRVTQKNALIYFNGYGCFCGKGGRGKPRDNTDMCCYKHDCCYEDLHRQGCHPFIEHYRYLIINNNVFCSELGGGPRSPHSHGGRTDGRGGSEAGGARLGLRGAQALSSLARRVQEQVGLCHPGV